VSRWGTAAVTLVVLALYVYGLGIVARDYLPCDLYPETMEPERCARDHWAN
jgi:hypothetical protein